MVTYTWGTNTCGIENLFNNQRPVNSTALLFPVKDTKLLKNKKFLSYNRTSLGHNILHIIISSPQKKIKNYEVKELVPDRLLRLICFNILPRSLLHQWRLSIWSQRAKNRQMSIYCNALFSKTKVLSDNQSLTETGKEILIFTGKNS